MDRVVAAWPKAELQAHGRAAASDRDTVTALFLTLFPHSLDVPGAMRPSGSSMLVTAALLHAACGPPLAFAAAAAPIGVLPVPVTARGSKAATRVAQPRPLPGDDGDAALQVWVVAGATAVLLNDTAPTPGATLEVDLAGQRAETEHAQIVVRSALVWVSRGAAEMQLPLSICLQPCYPAY
jgi:hypothetical protein